MQSDTDAHDDVTPSADGDSESVPLGNPTPAESVFAQFDPEPDALILGPDHLPIAVDPIFKYGMSDAPPLTPETMICLEQSDARKCRFYKRQRIHDPKAPDAPTIARFCTRKELRGINGACLFVGDTAIYECEFRKPKLPRNTEVLDAIDGDKIKKGKERLRQQNELGGELAYPIFRTVEQAMAGITEVSEDDAVLVSPTGEILERSKP